MKNLVLLVFFLVAIALSCGCLEIIGGNNSVNNTTPVTTISGAATLTPASPAVINATRITTTVNTTTISTVPTIPPTPTQTYVIIPTYTHDQLKDHFISVVFGQNSANIKRYEYQLVDISIDGEYKQEDIAAINDFAAQFDELSSTSKLIQEVERDRKADIMIQIMPEKAIRELSEEGVLQNQRVFNSSTIAFQARKKGDTDDMGIYLNGDLEGDVRAHYLVQSILYGLGFNGQSFQYPDSIFYSSGYNTTFMSIADREVVRWMYGGRIRSGMTAQDVRYIL
jgi:hypothetical protein